MTRYSLYTFAYISLAFATINLIFMPKRLSKQEICVTWSVMDALTFITDLLFGLTYDLYDFATKDVPLSNLFNWHCLSTLALVFYQASLTPFNTLSILSIRWYQVDCSSSRSVLRICTTPVPCPQNLP